MNKSGFTLLELIISLAIAAILSVSLTYFLSQANNYKTAVDNRASIYTRAAVVLHQLEKDISGAHIPIENIIAKQQESDAKQQKQAKANQSNQPSGEAKSEASASAKEKEIKPIAHVFFVDQKDKQLNILTCITNNPLKVYWSSTIGAPKPSIARIVYRLKPDPEHPNSFILFRQEGTELDFTVYDQKANAPIRSYEIINGIQSCSIKLIVVEQENNQEETKGTAQDKGKEAAPKSPIPEIKEYHIWDWPTDEKTKKEGEKQPSTALPTLILFTISLWDTSYEHSTEFKCTIPIFGTAIESSEKTKQEENKESENQQAGQSKAGNVPAIPPAPTTLTPATPIIRSSRDTGKQATPLFSFGLKPSTKT
ncbi:MAG TPA: prepilin-type N-terminal cleavage/methylation domain-containing protein [Candidatus Babeliales bacterium]|jgi:prepilin-type N-terminal cleavage/methylation domain-containing protein|nr:prepilin-type N-terminal cleavage/methylation domain-containing protein [Candidatus Babeliales bacterium]